MARPPRNPLARVKKAAQLPPLIVVAGDEPFLVLDAVDQIRRLAESGWEWEREEPVDTRALTGSLEEWLTPSMFASKRILHLVLKHKDFRAVLDTLKAAHAHPVGGQVVLIEIVDFDRRDRNTLRLSWIAKTLAPAGATVDATRLYESPPPWVRNPNPWDSELAQWTRERAKVRHGLTIAPRDLMMLVDRCGNDPGRLAGELEKLALLVHPGRDITPEAIHALVPDIHDTTLEACVRALQTLDARGLIKQLYEAEASGLETRGRRLVRPEEQAPVLLKVLQNAVETLIQAQRFRSRHASTGKEATEQLDALLGIERISLASLRTKARDEWLDASRRVRLETLLDWQRRIQETRRATRQGGPVRHRVWSLVTSMLEKRLLPAS